mmetsp:Transcript_128847/g.223457  ORF Transcript_128847/g.223457 Transcript_128847/m.223457 type:complete len:362 (-) Transcript_128847:104-1189(-)
MKESSGSRPASARTSPTSVVQQPTAQEFLLRSRQVDAMINALHYNSDSLRMGQKQKEHHERVGVQAAEESGQGKKHFHHHQQHVQRAELARGLQEESRPTTDKTPGDGPKSPDVYKPIRFASAPPRNPAAGVVPGLVRRPRPIAATGMAPSPQASPRYHAGRHPHVEPPWGPQRANKDRPPFEQVQHKQRAYCQILDSQAAEKQERQKQHAQEETYLDRTTFTSLESRHHVWGIEAPDAGRERALFNELVSTVNSKQRRARERESAERKDFARWADEAEKKMAWQWHAKMQGDKQEKERLGQQWMAAAKERQQIQEAEKKDKLKEEKEHVQRMVNGMVGYAAVHPRRMRKPIEDCALSARY